MFRPLKTSQVVVDVSVAVFFALVALPIEIGVAQGVWAFSLVLASAVAITLLFAAGLALRRVSPGLALGFVWAGALVQVALLRPPSFVDVAIFGVLYATAAYGGRVVFWLGFASTFVGAAVISGYLVVGPGFNPSGLSWSSIPVLFAVLVAAAFALGLAWTIGALVRTARRARATREAQQRAEADAMAEQERVRIARDMHDVVAHSLAVIVAQADGARYAVRAAESPGPSGAARSAAVEALGTISSTARAALADVRVLLGQLRHQQDAGPQPVLADVEALYAQVRAAGVDLRVDVDPAPEQEPPAAVQLAVYRVLQEALTNALRHGGGAVSVGLAWHRDHVALVVVNPLRTAEGVLRADSAHGANQVGHGIIGMRERAQLAGGRLDAGPEGEVFAVRARIPIGGAA
ncbi:sensor histidine kinase [Microbacterium sp. C7(2022)]|uniref:sensor histidine kinase n=1 Tax=Microbacterium sp. C7(2022) TaxID=2992759 RepID=UPI00237B7D72|nr:histidine kinase [Microbacterium sp. C7(2022)]MDE0545283.1 histidine kinase [Microbacterium sp. C7(2022)]